MDDIIAATVHLPSEKKIYSTIAILGLCKRPIISMNDETSYAFHICYIYSHLRVK